MKYLVLIFVCVSAYQSAFAGARDFVPVKIRTGDNVISLMRQNGFSLSQRENVLRRAPGLGGLFLTTDMEYLRARNGSDLEIRLHDLSSDTAFRIWRKGQEAGAEKYTPQFSTKIVSFKGHIRGGLMSSLFNLVRSNWVASRFMDAYLLETDLDSLAAGAKLAFTVEKKFENGRFVKYGEVLETSLEINGTPVRKNFMRFASGGVFVQPRDLLSERPFYAPVNYIRIASTFQPDRRHPITRRVQPHLGIDFELPEGTPIYAPRKGVVVRMGRSRAAGNYVVLLHANGLETAYNHLRRLAPGLREGQSVKIGQTVGTVGCTGYCTRPHLHFAVKVKGRMVNPARYIRAYPAMYEQSLQERVAAN